MIRRLRQLALDCIPGRMRVDGRERLRAMIGGAIGILVTALLCRGWLGTHGAWIVAPMGASAVLVFALPASPLAQPWSVIGGNSLSALVGLLCGSYFHDPAVAASVAVALAIGTMFSLRCLHPPGGAAALLCALSGAGPSFALSPVALNSLLLVLAGIVYNGLTGRRYPHAQRQPAATTSRFTAADLDAALAHYNQVVDISRDDLEELLHHAGANAYQRSFGELKCADIMTREPLAVEYGTPLEEAWSLLLQKHIKALPVIDRARRVVGVITLIDFMRATGVQTPDRLRTRLQALVRATDSTHSDKPEVVGQIMTAAVRTASQQQRLSELVSIYAEAGHHHLPIVDDERRLVGMITERDMVKALHGAVQPAS